MSDPSRRQARRRMLRTRYDELRSRYQRHRRHVERLIRDPRRFTTMTRACLAAVFAALEMALDDHVLSVTEHAGLLQAHMAFFRHTVDLYSECDAGFEVQITHPFCATAPASDVEAYLAEARRVRAQLTAQPNDIAKFYDLLHDNLASPYQVTASATLAWAKSRYGLSASTANQLDLYFAVMENLVEVEELHLLDTVRFFKRCLRQHGVPYDT